jgi:hypothetical protein
MDAGDSGDAEDDEGDDEDGEDDDEGAGARAAEEDIGDSITARASEA